MTVRLRAHHLLCLLTYVGKGYSPAFTANYDKVVRRLGEGWQMTGSGSAFFRHCRTRQEAEGAVEGLGCWTAVARPVAAW